MKPACLKALVSSIAFLIIHSAVFSQLRQLYTPTLDSGSVKQEFDSTLMGPKMNIKLDPNLLGSNDSKEFELLLPAFGKKSISVVAKRSNLETKSTEIAWYGQIEKQPKSFVLLTQVKDVIAGHIRTADNKIYRITYIGNNVHEIRLIDQRFFKPDQFTLATSINPLRNDQLKMEVASCCDGPVIDVLVVYTPAAKRAAGGIAGIESRIDECINQTNTSFQNSNIPVQVQLAYSAMVGYNESGSAETDRNALQDPADRRMDVVRTLRDNYHADIVVLLVNDANLSGVSYIMDKPEPAFEAYAYCVVKLDDAFSNLSFAHEIGHILGARHECNADNATTPFPYSHGYSASNYRTIMSGNTSATRIEFWSDPDIQFPGTNSPTGSLSGNCQANDAECLRRTIAIVAKFRCKQQCASVEPSSESTITPSTFARPQQSTITPTVEPPSGATMETTMTPNHLVSSSSTHSNAWIIFAAIALIVVLILWFVLRKKKKNNS